MWKCRLCWASGDETLDLTGRWIIEWFLFWIKRYIQLFIWTQNHTTHTEVECRLCRCGVDAGAGGIMVLTLVTSCKHILNIVWPPTSRPVIASYLTGVAAASAPAHLAPDCSTTHHSLSSSTTAPLLTRPQLELEMGAMRNFAISQSQRKPLLRPTSAFKFKTLLRHYAKQALTHGK